MMRYYSRTGEVIGRDEWVQSYTEEGQRVAYDKAGDVSVSTVWLGLDHQYGEGPPLIFETMIFGGEHDEFTLRYATEAEAVEGHKRACLLAGVE